jgi:hypothetical protein
VDERREPAQRQFLHLFVEQIVGDDADLYSSGERGEQRLGAADGPADFSVAIAIGGRGELHNGFRRCRTGGGEQPAEPLASRVFERHQSQHDIAMELLEEGRVQSLEIRRGHRTQAAVTEPHGLERVLRATPMIEQRVVEIEENGSYHWGSSRPRLRGPHSCVIHWRPMPAVVIAATNLMPALRERLAAEGELLTFADTEPIQALQTILEHRPDLIVLERLFAATPRGAALINRIKTDPLLGHAEVRVMSHTGDYSRQVAKPSRAPVAAGSGTVDAIAEPPVAVTPPPRLDWQGTRRALRYRARQGIEIQLDGNPASVVDVSTVGVQVISPTILRPNQKVRVSVPNDDFVMRFRGSIAWAKFELPKPSDPPRYRAGVDFVDADPTALEDYCVKIRE